MLRFDGCRKLCGLLGLLVLLAGAWPAGAQTGAKPEVDLGTRLRDVERDPAQRDRLYALGRKAAAVCAYCHGEGGQSVKSDVPNLAGQNAAYLLEQTRQFADGRRKNEFMQGMIKALKTDEKLGMVLFYASQPVQPSAPTQPALLSQGKAYFDRICFRCHGTDGRGSETVARIAGQQAEYLTKTLHRYRGGSGERINPAMAANTRLMSDADIQAVVVYVSSMP